MTQPTTNLPSPRGLRDRLQRLAGVHQEISQQHAQANARLQTLRAKLKVESDVSKALDQLSDRVFGDVIGMLEEKLSIALQEVLEQPIRLKVDCRYLRGAAAIEFAVEREGSREDIMRGQGGSVANILSVGLRMFALTTLDPQKHRRFLVLDEQDCWLHPDLVPRLVKIVHDAGSALGFQVLMISHHDLSAFERYADRIYRFVPDRDGVKVERWDPHPGEPNTKTPDVSEEPDA